MEYEYTEAGFNKASEAVIAFENGAELFVIEDAATYRRASILNACANLDNLYTRKEKEKAIDFEKEFTIDTPWMVAHNSNYVFGYACQYLRNAHFKFVVLSEGQKSKNAGGVRLWEHARHLTPEEEIKYLGAEK